MSANCQGTLVAGVAAARGDNGFGGSGVAPLASLAGIRIGAQMSDVDQASAFLHRLDDVQIENHSWHRADDGQTLAAPGPLAEDALSQAAKQGRAGAGRISVWAAGDGRARGDNCNFDGYTNNRFGIAVGAVNDSSQQAAYSESCSALFVSAPSSGVPGANRGLTTTDLLGADGLDATDYTDAFGGSAGAAPVVSGVAALMLAKNPALTWRDVQHILVRTSRQVDANDASWTSGLFPHSEKYGFGVIDALAAVNAAATWTNVQAESSVPQITHTVGVAIPDNNPVGVSDAIFVGSSYTGFSVEHVEVEFSAAHPHRGNLEVTLTSPAGVVSHLGTVRPGDGGANFAAWRFRSVRHWGESATGTWTLTVADRAAGGVGVFTAWTLRISRNVVGGISTRWKRRSYGSRSGQLDIRHDCLERRSGAERQHTESEFCLACCDDQLVQRVRIAIARTQPGCRDVRGDSSTGQGSTSEPGSSAGWLAGSFGAPQPVAASSSGRPATASSSKDESERPGVSDPETEPTPPEKADQESRPDAPIGLVASVSGSTIVLKWRPPASGSKATGYILEADSTSGDVSVFPTGGTSTSFTEKGVKAGTYSIRVRASNASGTSEPSNEAKVVVGDCTAPPSAPSGLSFSVNGSTVVLTWDASKSAPTSYVVETETGSEGNSPVVVDTGGPKTTFTAEDVAPGTYFARVRARNACGGSARSERVMVVVH